MNAFYTQGQCLDCEDDIGTHGCLPRIVVRVACGHSRILSSTFLNRLYISWVAMNKGKGSLGSESGFAIFVVDVDD
jgi:hypothetical protein